MAAYAVEFAPAAEREFRKIKDRGVQRRLADAISGLSTNPRPRGVEKLAGSNDLFRIRAGDYRVVFEIHDDRLFVLVVRLAHRSIVYTRQR